MVRRASKNAITLAAAKLLSDDDLLGRVNAVNLKHVLGDIQTDRGNSSSPHFLPKKNYKQEITLPCLALQLPFFEMGALSDRLVSSTPE